MLRLSRSSLQALHISRCCLTASVVVTSSATVPVLARREIVGIMYDNMRQGRKRHIWVTNDKLLKQAIKDWTRVTGQDGNAVIKSLKNWKPGDKIAWMRACCSLPMAP